MNGKLNIPAEMTNYLLSNEWAIDIGYGLSFLSKVLYNQANGIVYEAPPPFVTLNAEGMPSGSTLSALESGSMVRLRYSGAMVTDDKACGAEGIQTLSDRLHAAYNSKNISGILLELNSGGGEGLSADILNDAIADKNKPVVVRTHVLGSAAVKGTVTANEIIASNENAQIGSIGAFFTLDKRFVNWYKENMEDIYSEGAPDKNKAFRAYFDGDKKMLQEVINNHDQKFKEHVSANRNLKGSKSTVAETLAGGMFYAMDAKSRGLIDGVGGLNYAIKRLQSHIKNSSKF